MRGSMASLYDLLRDPNAPPSPFEPPEPPPRSTSTGLRASMFQRLRGDRSSAAPERQDQRRGERQWGRKLKRDRVLEQRRAGAGSPTPDDEPVSQPAPMRLGRPRAASGLDRLAQLRAFQLERARKRQDVHRTVKPPFRVGVYQLAAQVQTDLPPVAESTRSSALKNVPSRISTRRTAAQLPLPVRAKKSLFKKNVTASPQRLPAARKMALTHGARSYVQAATKPMPRPKLTSDSSGPSAPARTRLNLDLDLHPAPRPSLNLVSEATTGAPVQTSSPVHPCVEPERGPRRRSSRIATQGVKFGPVDHIIPEESAVQATSESPEGHCTPATETAPPWGPSSSSTSLTPFIAAMGVTATPRAVPVCTEVSNVNFQFLSPSVVGNFKFTATPKAPEPKALLDKDGFKTPTPLSGSIKSRRSKRVSEVGGLIDALRHDVIFERGSGSAKRRLKKGLKPYPELNDISFDEIPSDPFSPFHEVMRRRSQPVLDPVLTPAAALKRRASTTLAPTSGSAAKRNPNTPVPKKLAMEFDEIARVPSVPTHDIQHFRSSLKVESDRLAALGTHWEWKLTSLPASQEEAVGQIRSTLGKAKLMANPKGRFAQFAQLIDNCEFNLGEKKTTLMDLQGFWEMIYYQVEDIDVAFKDLNTLEANGWTPPVVSNNAVVNNENRLPPPRKVGPGKPKKAGRKSPTQSSAALRELMAHKRKQIQAKHTLQPPVSSPEKLFDGGFFSVRSPLRTISPANPGGARPTASLQGDITPHTPSSKAPRATRSSTRLSARPRTAQILNFAGEEAME
eukprot:maker-scaffold849_size89187-snap-gene-0.17 protein:Tk02981 transcript:maker-scaffold849_size89187-snap-gene-0.17-mRNA-1 annotation:"disks large-associated protein 5"